MLDNNGAKYNAGKYSLAEDGNLTNLEVLVKGEKPSTGNVCIGSDGTVKNASLKINGYVINYDGKDATVTDSEAVETIECPTVELKDAVPAIQGTNNFAGEVTSILISGGVLCPNSKCTEAWEAGDVIYIDNKLEFSSVENGAQVTAYMDKGYYRIKSLSGSNTIFGHVNSPTAYVEYLGESYMVDPTKIELSNASEEVQNENKFKGVVTSATCQAGLVVSNLDSTWESGDIIYISTNLANPCNTNTSGSTTAFKKGYYKVISSGGSSTLGASSNGLTPFVTYLQDSWLVDAE